MSLMHLNVYEFVHILTRNKTKILSKISLFLECIDIFLTKTHGFATGGLYSPPGAVRGMFLLWMDALYLTSFGLSNRNTHILPL